MEDKDETKKGIELDKIEVPSKSTPSPETPPAEKTESEPKVSPRKISTFRPILTLVSKKKVLVGAVLAGLVVALGVIYLASEDTSSDKSPSGAHYIGKIVYDMATSMGGQHDVRFTLSVPFTNFEEKKDLMQRLPSIKHELSISGSHPDMARSIEQEDLPALRHHIVQMVHALTGVPAEDLAVQALSLE